MKLKQSRTEDIKDEINKTGVTQSYSEALSDDDVLWLIQQAEKTERYEKQLSELICAIYEHANEGTELMEIAERIDEME